MSRHEWAAALAMVLFLLVLLWLARYLPPLTP